MKSIQNLDLMNFSKNYLVNAIPILCLEEIHSFTSTCKNVKNFWVILKSCKILKDQDILATMKKSEKICIAQT